MGQWWEILRGSRVIHRDLTRGYACIHTNAHFSVLYTAWDVLLSHCAANWIFILSWLVRQCYSFCHYGTFSKTAGGQRSIEVSTSFSRGGLSPSASCPAADTLCWLAGWLVGAEWRWHHAVSRSYTYCRCRYDIQTCTDKHMHTKSLPEESVKKTYTYFLFFLPLSQTLQGKLRVSRLQARIMAPSRSSCQETMVTISSVGLVAMTAQILPADCRDEVI